MKIGTIGSGTVARTLSAAWTAQGHEVFMGARDPKADELTKWQQGLPPNLKIQIGSVEQAAALGEVILIAINPWTEIEKALKPLTTALKGKTVIDVSNNIGFNTRPPKLAFIQPSMGESIQTWLPEANIVKTLNITPAAMMVNPAQSGIVPAIGWMSGNNGKAKQQIATLLKDIGWSDVVDLGDIRQASLQESIGLTLSIIVSGIAT